MTVAPLNARAGVEADAHAAGRAVVGDAAIVGQEVVRRVFGRHAALHGKAGGADGLLAGQADLRVGQRHALGDENLRLDEVDAGDFLGHRVLDLNPRIDLDEVELVRVAIDEELDRAGVLVLHRPADLDRRVAQRLPHGRIEVRRGGDLDDLLVPPLHRAVALEQVHQVAVLVAEDLHLDVAGPA